MLLSLFFPHFKHRPRSQHFAVPFIMLASVNTVFCVKRWQLDGKSDSERYWEQLVRYLSSCWGWWVGWAVGVEEQQNEGRQWDRPKANERHEENFPGNKNFHICNFDEQGRVFWGVNQCPGRSFIISSHTLIRRAVLCRPCWMERAKFSWLSSKKKIIRNYLTSTLLPSITMLHCYKVLPLSTGDKRESVSVYVQVWEQKERLDALCWAHGQHGGCKGPPLCLDHAWPLSSCPPLLVCHTTREAVMQQNRRLAQKTRLSVLQQRP